MAKRNFIPLVPSGTINADASVAQLEQDVLAMDAKVGELAEDIGDTEQEIVQLKSQIDDIAEHGGIEKNIELTWTNGDINIFTGEVVQPPTTSWKHTQLIPAAYVNGGKYTNDSTGTISAMYCFEYNADGSYSKQLSTIPSTTSYTFPDNFVGKGKFIRIELSWRCNANAKIVNVAPTLATLEDLADAKDFPDIIMPSAIYAVEGAEMNLYFDNVILGNYGDYALSCQIDGIYWTHQYADRFSMQPAVGDHGDYSIHFQLYNKKTWNMLASKNIPLHVLADNALTGKTALFIGDSLTNSGYFTYEIQNNLSSNGVTSIGTVVSHPYFNDVAVNVYAEGRGGWSPNDYVTKASKGDVTNAFWNPSTSKFDFSYYLSNNSLSAPDIVFIFLGTNGIENTSESVAAIEEMITSIHAHTATMPIVVSPPTPPATQNGWTYTTKGGSVDRFKWLELLMVQAYMEAFDGETDNHIYFAPTHINIDRQHDFPYTEADCSARNPYKVYMQTDNVHPAKYGYFKMADVFWAMIQKILG